LYLKNKESPNDLVELVTDAFSKLKDKRENMEMELHEMDKVRTNMEFLKQKIQNEQRKIEEEKSIIK